MVKCPVEGSVPSPKCTIMVFPLHPLVNALLMHAKTGNIRRLIHMDQFDM